MLMVEVVLVLGQPTSTPKIYNFGKYRHYGNFQKFQRQHTAPPMELFRSREYPVGAFDVSLFGVAAGDCKGCVGPSNTQITYKDVYCWIGGDNFVLSGRRKYSSMSH